MLTSTKLDPVAARSFSEDPRSLERPLPERWRPSGDGCRLPGSGARKSRSERPRDPGLREVWRRLCGGYVDRGDKFRVGEERCDPTRESRLRVSNSAVSRAFRDGKSWILPSPTNERASEPALSCGSETDPESPLILSTGCGRRRGDPCLSRDRCDVRFLSECRSLMSRLDFFR